MIKPLAMNTINFKGSSTNLLEKFKQEHKIETPVTQPTTLSGSEIDANYNKAMLNQIPSYIKDIKPSELVTIKGDEADTLKGEKVFDSSGNLEAIIVKGDKTTKEYHFFSDKLVDKIVEKDNETGRVIKVAQFGTEQNKLTSATVTEYGPLASDEKYTTFANGKLKVVQDTKNGQSRGVIFNDDGSIRSSMETENANGMNKYTLYENNKIKSIKYFNDEDKLTLKTEYSPDGDEAITYTNGKITVPDFDINKIKEGFKPADINSVKIPENIEALQGEKKFRSNGSLEKVEVKGEGNKSTEYFIDFDGKKIKSIWEKEDDRTVRNMSMNEDFNIFAISDWKNDTTTFFKKDGSLDSISINNGNTIKRLEFSKNGNAEYYDEWDPKTKRTIISVLLDKNGEVTRYTKDSNDGYITIIKGLGVD